MGIYKNHDGRERGVNLKGSKLIYLLLALVVLSGLVFALPGTNVFAAGPGATVDKTSAVSGEKVTVTVSGFEGVSGSVRVYTTMSGGYNNNIKQQYTITSGTTEYIFDTTGWTPGTYELRVFDHTSGWSEVLAQKITVASAPSVDPDTVVEDVLGSFVFGNKAQASELKKALEAKLAGAGYTVTVENWQMLRSVGGCEDQEGVIYEGYDGYISAAIRITGNGYDKTFTIDKTIEPAVTTYSFESVARTEKLVYDEDEDMLIGEVVGRDGEYFMVSKDGKTLLGYCGEAEKIVFPEGVTTLDASWWLDTDLDKIRCVILPDSLTALPDQFAVPFGDTVEVITMGDNVTKAEGWHTFWKCYRLKHLRLSENLENFTEEALFETLQLVDLHIPNNLKTIGKGTFHLSAIRDIVVPAGVETIEQEAFAWPLRQLDYLNPESRPQGNAVPNEICEELNPYLQEQICLAPGSYIPRTITVLSKNVAYASTQNFWNSHASWCTVQVRYIEGSTTDELIAGGYNPASTVYSYSKIDMDKKEIVARLKNALARVPLYADTTEEDVLAFAKSLIVSSQLGSEMAIADFELVPATKDADGHASGTLSVSVGSDTITLQLSRNLPYAAAVPVDLGSMEPPEPESSRPESSQPESSRPGSSEPADSTASRPAESDGSAPNTGYAVPVAVMGLAAAALATMRFVRRKKGME